MRAGSPFRVDACALPSAASGAPIPMTNATEAWSSSVINDENSPLKSSRKRGLEDDTSEWKRLRAEPPSRPSGTSSEMVELLTADGASVGRLTRRMAVLSTLRLTREVVDSFFTQVWQRDVSSFLRFLDYNTPEGVEDARWRLRTCPGRYHAYHMDRKAIVLREVGRLYSCAIETRALQFLSWHLFGPEERIAVTISMSHKFIVVESGSGGAIVLPGTESPQSLFVCTAF